MMMSGETIVTSREMCREPANSQSLVGGLAVAQGVAPSVFTAKELDPHPYKFALPHARSVGKPGGEWAKIDSPLADYERSFRGVLDPDSRILDLLPSGPGRKVVVVDLMATPAALKDLRSQYLDREGLGAAFRGVAVGLHLSDKSYRLRDLSFIEGNVRRPFVMDQLAQQTGGRGQVDLIMERAAGGVGALPPHPRFYEAAFRTLWDFLRPGGVLLAQTPSLFEMRRAGIFLPDVVARLNDQGVEAKTDVSGFAEFSNGSVLIRKPAKLVK